MRTDGQNDVTEGRSLLFCERAKNPCCCRESNLDHRLSQPLCSSLYVLKSTAKVCIIIPVAKVYLKLKYINHFKAIN